MFKILIFVTFLVFFDNHVLGLDKTRNLGQLGTPCECNPAKTWLDIVLVIDRSSLMGTLGINGLSAQLLTLFYDLNIGQHPGNNTRIGVVSFASTARVEAELTSFNSFSDLEAFLLNLVNLVDIEDTVVDVDAGLREAINLVKKSKLHGPPVILLFPSAASVTNVRNPLKTSTLVKQGGIKIISVDYSNGVINGFLEKLSTSQMSFSANVKHDDLFLALCQANCVCPSFTSQFIHKDVVSGKVTYYADCFHGDSNTMTQDDAKKSCSTLNNGVLVSIENFEKYNFIKNMVAPVYVGKTQPYWIGLHKNEREMFSWYGYDKKELLMTNFAAWNKIPRSNKFDGKCIWSNSVEQGAKWNMGTCEATYGYVCQTRACDAENPCEFNRGYTIF